MHQNHRGLSRVFVGTMLLALIAGCDPGMADSSASEGTKESIALSVASETLSLNVGESVEINAAVSTDTQGALYVVRYESADSTVATVSPNGLVTGVANGTTSIEVTATIVQTGAMATASVSVAIGAAAGTTTPLLTLSNLPAKDTTATSASIAYKLNSTDPKLVVYCRRDVYDPIVCPNPFVLGQATPLAAGPHVVDFYVDRGTGVDPTKPEVSYSWTISAPGPGPGPGPTPSPVTALAAPTPSETSWPLGTGTDGRVHFDHVLDPSGSGKTVNLHRIYSADSLVWGGQRSEVFYYDIGLTPATDSWMAFAVQQKSDETLLPSTFDDTMLVFQTHTPQAGDTQPDIALFASKQSNLMRWQVAYNTSGNVDSKGWMTNEGASWIHKEPMPPPGVWWRYVVHYRPGYTTAHAPRLQIWRAKPGAAFEQIVDHTGFNTYNTSKTGAGPSYPRIGPYKWSSWNQSSIAWYETPLYFGRGADLLEAGKASLAGL